MTYADWAGHVAPVPQLYNACFFVTADARTGMMPRLLAPFAKLGAVPYRIHASTESGNGGELTVDLRIANVSSREADRIEKTIRVIIGVRTLLVVTDPL